MKLSFPVTAPDTSASVMAWCNTSYEESFSCLSSMGYDAVELLVRDPATVDRQELTACLNKYQLTLSAIGTSPMQKEDGLFLMSPDDEKRAEAIRRLDSLLELGAYYHVPVLMGKYRGTVQDRNNCRMSDFEQIMYQADKKAKAAGIEIFLEPQQHSAMNNLNSISESAEWIIKNSFSNIKLLADLFHMEATEDSVTKSLEHYHNYIGMIHMSDSSRYAPGFGTLPMKDILNIIKAIDFKGYLSLEIKQQPDSKTAAMLSLLSIEYMKKVVD